MPPTNQLTALPPHCAARAAAKPGPQLETGLRVLRMRGDGRCMFRALAVGLARLQGKYLGGDVEELEADQLRLAVAEALCRSAKRRNEFAPAVYAIEAEDKLDRWVDWVVGGTALAGGPSVRSPPPPPRTPNPWAPALTPFAATAATASASSRPPFGGASQSCWC